MILASAVQLGCEIVWSEDLNPDQVYEQTKVQSPF
jgi:predicted nucleic acid-binding protein